jgi:hypothetical protein
MEDEHMGCRDGFEVLTPQARMSVHGISRAGRQLRGWWGDLACGVVMLLGVVVMALGSVTSAHADVVQCGDVLGPGGRFELEADLDCDDATAVTLQNGAILDLKGHIVFCRGPAPRCVVLTGIGTQLLNGVVQATLHESIVLEGQGVHTVRNVTSTQVDGNIVVASNHNHLIDVMAESVLSSAFIINGDRNRLTNNVAHCQNLLFGGCISVAGNGNRLIDNFANCTRGCDSPNFSIGGNDNVLQGNRAIRNEPLVAGSGSGNGIVVTGTGNRLTRNTALETDIDLQDGNGDCDHNTWRQDTFQTSDPACIQ